MAKAHVCKEKHQPEKMQCLPHPTRSILTGHQLPQQGGTASSLASNSAAACPATTTSILTETITMEFFNTSTWGSTTTRTITQVGPRICPTITSTGPAPGSSCEYDVGTCAVRACAMMITVEGVCPDSCCGTGTSTVYSVSFEFSLLLEGGC
jgi:hypothetical protein